MVRTRFLQEQQQNKKEKIEVISIRVQMTPFQKTWGGFPSAAGSNTPASAALGSGSSPPGQRRDLVTTPLELPSLLNAVSSVC